MEDLREDHTDPESPPQGNSIQQTYEPFVEVSNNIVENPSSTDYRGDLILVGKPQINFWCIELVV